MLSVDVKKRKISANEIALFESEIKNDPFVSSYSKKEWERAEHVFVAEIENRMAGFCMCDEITNGWVEIGLLFVLKEARRSGVGDNLVKAAVADAEKRGKNMFMVSRNPDLNKKFKSYGFRKCKFYQLPASVIVQQVFFSLKPFRVKENLGKLLSGNVKGNPVFGVKIVKDASKK